MSGAKKGRPPAAFDLDDPHLIVDGPPPLPPIDVAPAKKEEAPAPKKEPEALKVKAEPPKTSSSFFRARVEAPRREPEAPAPKAEAPKVAPEAPTANPAAAPAEPQPAAAASAPEAPQPSRETKITPEFVRVGRSWGGIFLSAVSGLLVLAVLVWVQDTFLTLLGRKDWLGWAATIFLSVAVFSFVMILAREIVGLYRLAAVTLTRKRAEAALAAENAPEALAAVGEIRTLFEEKRELADGIARFNKYQRDIMNAKEVLTLAEREMLTPLDKVARTTVGTSGRRVSIVTALSPAAIFAVGFVAYENFRMLRNLASIYGGRPGLLSMLRLMRLIAGHLAVTGGIAFTDDILGQFMGHGVTSRVSRRLGEGLVNGSFTIRIGIAAVEVLRPLPYIEARQPRLREFVSEFLKVGQKPEAAQQPERARV
jgi:putative membrane protein